MLLHLGVKPGDKIELDLLPGGCCKIMAARRKGSMNDFVGLLAGRGAKVASIDEINDACAGLNCQGGKLR